MRKHSAGSYLAIIVALVSISLSGACENGFLDPAGRNGVEHGGSLRISLGAVSSMSLLPDISMDPAGYVLRGRGPDDHTFEVTTSENEVLVEGLSVGTWTVTVDVLNAEGQRIGTGLGTVTITAGSVRQLPITVRPLPGPGTLELMVNWNPADIAVPRIGAFLIGYDRTETELPFELSGNDSAEFASDSVDAGYYTLTLQMRDADNVVAGAVTTVRIAENARTAGSFSFFDINSPSGGLDLVITPELDEPLQLSIIGAPDAVIAGEALSVSASVSNAVGAEVFFLWYLNGGAVGSGAELQLGDLLTVGRHRLDLVGHTSDGLRSGSVSHLFSVLNDEAEPGSPPPIAYDFIDTFENGAVDTNLWRVGTWTEHGGRLSRDRVYVENDMLVMVFEYDTDFYAETGLFKSSAIQTERHDFGFGRWEARLKPTDEDGVLPTMYTIDWRDGGAQSRQEIDFEFVSVNIGDEYSEVHLAVHGADFNSWSTQVELPFNPAADFHVWGFDITAERIQWFVDDIVLYEYWYHEQPGRIDAPYMLKFNFWSAMYQPGTPGAGNWILGPPVADTEIYYYIDWVRFTSYDS